MLELSFLISMAFLLQRLFRSVPSIFASSQSQAKRLTGWRYKPAVPSVIMGNVNSLLNKTDELSALIRSDRTYRESSLLCLTETWLTRYIPEVNVELPGFHLVRADRDCKQSGKRKGGGLALYVNIRWCNPGHVTVKEKLCSKDIELLAVSLRSYYIPREFTHAIAVVVYIPPHAHADTACDIIHSVVLRLQTQNPETFILISGDFNHVTLDNTLHDFHQFVDCPTRLNRKIDLLYANSKEAYSANPLPPLGKSDHNLVLLRPQYPPKIQSQPKTTRPFRKWSPLAEETLTDCFESTVHYFPNNKSWITSDIKDALNRKKRTFRDGDREGLKQAQQELKVSLNEAKASDSRKMRQKQKHERGMGKGLEPLQAAQRETISSTTF